MGAKCGKCQPCHGKSSERETWMDLSVGPERQTMSTTRSSQYEKVDTPVDSPRETRKSEELIVQQVEWRKESVTLEPKFDPVKAEAIYTEKRVALMSEKAVLEKSKCELEQQTAQKESELNEKTAEFEKEQETKTQEMLVKQKGLAVREQQCKFRWIKLSKMLQQVEAEEKRKKEQREAGTKRLEELRLRLQNAEEKVEATNVLDENFTDLDASFERRQKARAALEAKKNKRISWGNRKCKLLKKAKKQIDNQLKRKVKPSHLSRKKDVQSIYTNVRDFEPTPSKCNLVFDENRNVLTKHQALKKVILKQKNEHKLLDRQLAVLESERERLAYMLKKAEGCSPVVVGRLDRQIDSLSKKYQTLSAKRYQANLAL